jgi:hypothetical protein
MVAVDASTAIEAHPYEPKSVGVKFQSGLNESELCSPSKTASTATLQHAAPWRRFRWYRGQKRETTCLTGKLTRTAGGPDQFKAIMLLALVVGLQSADNGTVGALVVPLKHSLHIDNTQVGLLVTVSTGIGALATLPAGALADRSNRVRLLWITMLMCSAAMALSAASPSYGWLLACRVASAPGWPCQGRWSPR